MVQKAAALGTLAVEELFGELASSVFQSLVAAGRLTLVGLIATSSLGPKEVKHGLATLIQHGLALWYSAPAEGTFYEPSLQSAYRLLQLGKYARLVDQRFGKDAASLMSNLFVSGNIQVGDVLRQRPDDSNSKSAPRPGRPPAEQDTLLEHHTSEREREEAIKVLIDARVLTAGRPTLVQPQLDILREAERKVNLDTGTQAGTRGKTKVDHKAEVQRLILKWTLRVEETRKPADAQLMDAVKRFGRKRPRESIDDSSPPHSRKVVRFSDANAFVNGNGIHPNLNGDNSDASKIPDESTEVAIKMKKGALKKPVIDSIQSGSAVFTSNSAHPPLPHRMSDDGAKEEKVSVRVDFERLALMARNELLVSKVAETIGQPTARVYRILLQLVEAGLSLPERGILSVDADTTDDLQCKDSRTIFLYQIVDAMDNFDDLNYLESAVSVEQKLPKTSARYAKKAAQERDHQLNSKKQSTDDVRAHPVDSETSSEDEDAEESDEEDYQSPSSSKGHKRTLNLASRKTEYDEDSTITSFRRTDFIRQHLLMLSEHSTPFLTYHGRELGGGENFSVPYSLLIRHVRREALFEAIHARYDHVSVAERKEYPPLGDDTAAVRIARMLAERGKLDDKALANLSLINPKTLRARLAMMHNGGAIGVQEVPRDAQRNANRTLYLWFFDDARCAEKLIEDTYQIMTRLLQRLRSERAFRRHLLDKAERSDVKGKEDEFLSKQEVKQLHQWHAFEERVWSDIGRLDELVSLLRDY